MSYQCKTCAKTVSFPNKALLMNHIIGRHANILWETEMAIIKDKNRKEQGKISNSKTYKLNRVPLTTLLSDLVSEIMKNLSQMLSI